MDYSGFDREKWKPRNGVDHRRVGLGMRQFSTKADQEMQESKQGLRYSSLSLLRCPSNVDC